MKQPAQRLLFDETLDDNTGVRAKPTPNRRSTATGRIGPYELNTVNSSDCIEGMKALPSRSVDIAIADPPYNLSKGGRWTWDNSAPLPGFGGDWSKVMAEWDDMPLGEYLAFTLAWLRELQRVVRPTGSIWVHGTYHNIGIINFAMQLLEIEIINEVVWYKRNSFPNLSGRRLTASHETILWAHTGGKKRQYLFNYELVKDAEWPEDALKKAGKQLRTVWDIPNNKKREELQHGKHPTQKPMRLLRRMLEMSAKPGDLLLVPFAGAGSDCVVAEEFGANFIAFETDPKYVEICRSRLGISTSAPEARSVKISRTPREVRSVPSLAKWTGSKRTQARFIADLFPSYHRYFEPFLGGGAMLFLAGHPGAIAGDAYKPLIDLWKLAQSEPETLTDNYRKQWKALNEELARLRAGDSLSKGDGFPRYYYEVRRRFNRSPNPLDLNFLMRTCVNGIIRFNDRGEFNNSFHLSRNGMMPNRFETVVDAWRETLQGVEFVCQDYRQTLSQAERGDFAYLDPPYAGNKQRYVEDLDLVPFFDTLNELNKRGVRWALSFDGVRGDQNLTWEVPESLYERHLYLDSGNSAVKKVLNGPVEQVRESLYLSY